MNRNKALLLKRKLKEIKSYKGEGTQLISLYLPPNADRSSVTKQLTDESSQSSNIKSQHTRKNVQAALKRIINYLRQIDFKLPENGLVLFSGNVSENPSKIDVILLIFEPPKLLKTKLYWCDSSFHIAPLEELVQSEEVYGIVAIDKREATIAILNGKSYTIVNHTTSGVPGKTRAGGQCLKNCLVQQNNGSLIDIEDCKNNQSINSIFKNNNYTTKSSKIDMVWNVNKNKTYKIITKCPRLEIECSEDHVLFVTNFDDIIEKKAKDLTTEDYLIVPEIIITKGKKQLLNIKENYNSLGISKKGGGLLKNKRLKLKLTQKDLSGLLNLSPTTISKIELGKQNIRPQNIKNICGKLNINYTNFLKNFTSKNELENIELPKILDPIFAKFIGYLIGDGCLEVDRISFFEQNKEVALHYKKTYDTYFNICSSYRFRESKNYHQLRFTSRPLVRFIKQNFPEIKKALDSRVPNKICKSNVSVIGGFLRGIYDAEGYINKNRKSVGFSVNNKKLATEMQLLLLRFSIISSLFEYDNRANKYSNNPKFTISISERKSIELFKEKIGFTFKEKSNKLDNILKMKSKTSYSRQIFKSGKYIRKIIEKYNCNLELFPKVSSFFNNKRKMSKEIFKDSILKNIKNKELYYELLKIYNIPLLPVRIKDIKITTGKTKMIDISIKNKNFLANGIMVHNSAARFERLREKAAQDFYKRVAERINTSYVGLAKFKGMVFGGPGLTKQAFIDQGSLDHRIKNKVLGTVDTCYTNESGIKEILDKCTDILKDVGIVKERNLINKFLEQVAKNQLATYGFLETIESIKQGKASIVLVSEAIEWNILKFKCSSCNIEIPKIVKDKDNIKKVEKSLEHACPNCGQPMELIEEVDFFDYIVDLTQPMGGIVELISTETSEGNQFFYNFGGVAALLRYK